jgi:hypothetical protein
VGGAGVTTDEVEFLYRWATSNDHGPCVEKLQVVKVTRKQVHFVDTGVLVDDDGKPMSGWRSPTISGWIRFVDRQLLEAYGEASPAGELWYVYVSLADAYAGVRRATSFWPWRAAPTAPVDEARIAKLKAEMIAAHPDRGGTNDKFIAAHKRYRSAKGDRP